MNKRKDEIKFIKRHIKALKNKLSCAEEDCLMFRNEIDKWTGKLKEEKL